MLARLGPWVFVAGSLLMTTTRRAGAEVAEVGLSLAGPARLEVRAGSTCTSREQLMARVLARVPSVRFVDDGASVAVSVQFTAAPEGATLAEVAFTSTAGRAPTRRVLAHDCAEATDAAALIIAMTLSPVDTDNSDASDSASDPSNTERELLPPPVVDRQPAREAEAVSFGVQLAGQSFIGPAPRGMVGLAAYATLGLDRDALWSPAVLLGATHAWRSQVQAEGGKASFRLDAASFDACPLRFRLGPVQARPCASALIGRFSASGAETRNAAESHRPFWVVGGAALMTTDLFWLLELSTRVSVGANLVRDSFEFTPSVFHEVPAFTVAASVGVGLRFR